MIYLFTTTSKQLYKRDLLNVCCLEEGESVLFGYQADKVDQEIKNEYEQDANKIINEDALVIFCEYFGDHKIYSFHPVRKCLIKDFHKTATGSYEVQLQLKELILYSIDNTDNKELVSRFEKILSQFEVSKRPSMSKGENSKIFISKGPDIPLEIDDSNSRWEYLASYMGALNDLKNSIFFREYPLRKARRSKVFENWLVPDKVSKDDPFLINYSGKSGRRYKICLRHVYGKDSERDERFAQIFADSDKVKVCGPFIKQSGEGVMADYILILQSVFKKQSCELVIKAGSNERPQNDRMNDILSTEIRGFLEIEPRIISRYIAEFFPPIGIVLITIGGFFVKEIISDGFTFTKILGGGIFIVLGIAMQCIGSYQKNS